jgi:hypothetical protein
LTISALDWYFNLASVKHPFIKSATDNKELFKREAQCGKVNSTVGHAIKKKASQGVDKNASFPARI